MNAPGKNEFVPYADTKPGFESIYTGEEPSPDAALDAFVTYGRDSSGYTHLTYSSWGFARHREEEWTDEIRHINGMQKQLGSLDDATRLIRAQIASLQCCDSGIPVTIDEILEAVGTGELRQPAFHPGCWLSLSPRSTQPGQREAMEAIESMLHAYVAGEDMEAFADAYPAAASFIRRSLDWLGPVSDLSELQRLMIERMLLPFDFLTGRTEDHQAVHARCYGPDGRGAALDRDIARLAELPAIHANYTPEYREHLKSIEDPQKREIYRLCGAMAHGLHGLSDCHHSTFRWVESWIHGIGRFSLDVEGRKAGVEATRLGCLLFGYALGLDRWLQGIPMQWLLLDLGHIDLGFDPKSEILRVYAHLGDMTPAKEWLAACLWYTLVLERPASLFDWGHRHRDLIARAETRGVSVREWINSKIGRIA